MKKISFYFISILMILICFFIYLIFFRHIKSSEILIDNFSKITVDSLNPVVGKGYSLRKIKIKGYINDSILIRGFYGYPIYLSGKVDKEFNTEYYGSFPSIINIEPYKATSGKIKITHIIK
ncbi:hypothetical protein SAMN05421738_1331 [Algoriella xinjiangensis]|jgi:hypothetical protein|uniref:Uncharacterized protein n=1 Tax=Algoriella xinjiangensis TaxID=684065 RepID=A0A1I5BGF4_9FLAO|nr:hypothetical protein [Algoriella xinjiangensis]SFN73571.1 hypothetical protein SAMN05421738_1331 [Algoriella xinjiangensis]